MFPRLFLVSILVLASATLRAQESQKSDAPFGLTWGMSSRDAKSHGIELTEAPYKEYGKSFIARKLRAVIADTETIVLSFGRDDKLWRIVAVSRDYTFDPYGTAVKARYQELLDTLGEKYGKGKSHHQADRKYWKAANEFVMGIKAGMTHWFTDYDTPAMTIEIGIIASSPDEANWRIIFEDKDLHAAFERSTKSKDKKAL
jgi:hypothetical protein